MISFIDKIASWIFGAGTYQKYLDNYVGKNSTLLFIIQCVSIGLVFISNFILVKVAGTDTYGAYVYFFNLIYLLVSFCLLGFDTLLVQKTAIYNESKKFPELKGILVFALAGIIFSSFIVAMLFQVILNFSAASDLPGDINWFTIAFISLLMLSITTLVQTVLQGMRKIVWSQVAEKIFRPLILTIVVTSFYFFRSGITFYTLTWINVFAIGIAMLIALNFLLKIIPRRLNGIIAVYDLPLWIKSSLAFFVADILYNVNSRVTIFLLGIFQSKHNVGIFNIALRISEVIGFALVIVNFVLSPVIARLHANGKGKTLQKIITGSAKAVLVIGGTLTIAIILFSKPILLLFGSDFVAGQQALIVLSLGQFANIFCGSVGLLLLMTGNQKYSIYSLAGGTTVNILLNLLLTPGYGINGAAIASACSLIIWNVMMYYFVRKKINICPTAFGFL